MWKTKHLLVYCRGKELVSNMRHCARELEACTSIKWTCAAPYWHVFSSSSAKMLSFSTNSVKMISQFSIDTLRFLDNSNIINPLTLLTVLKTEAGIWLWKEFSCEGGLLAYPPMQNVQSITHKILCTVWWNPCYCSYWFDHLAKSFSKREVQLE